MWLEDFSPAPVRLLPDAALLVQAEQSCLVAADLHLGKSASFRAHGMPIPEGDTERDLNRLQELVSTHRPDRVVIAGDLFHAPAASRAGALQSLMDFIDAISIPFTLVTGNHDRKIRDWPRELVQTEHFDIGGLRIVHRPEDADPTRPHLCGHIHPVLKIPDGRNTSLRLPCFHWNRNILTLPSFGSFTGGHPIKPTKADRFFVSHLGSVIEVPHKLLGLGS